MTAPRGDGREIGHCYASSLIRARRSAAQVAGSSQRVKDDRGTVALLDAEIEAQASRASYGTLLKVLPRRALSRAGQSGKTMGGGPRDARMPVIPPMRANSGPLSSRFPVPLDCRPSGPELTSPLPLYLGRPGSPLRREMEDQTALRARVPCLCSELDPLDLFHLTFITARSSPDALSCRASL